MALVSKQPPCWYINGTRFANRKISTGLSAAIPSPKIRPTSTWNGFPCVTLGARVIVVTNFESMVLESPFLISNSSIGDKHDVGGLSNFTGFPFNNRSPWNASSNARTCCGLSVFGFNFSSNSETSHNSFAARPETPENVRRRNVVILDSDDSEQRR